MSVFLQKTKYEMRNSHGEKGFSLTEVLIAVGILAVGMLFIAGVFPVSIHFTTVSSERTIAAVAADEAFAKIQLYGIPPAILATMSGVSQTPIESLSPIPFGEYAYPSTGGDLNQKKYFWSAECRRVGPTDVQVTVFVSRKIGITTSYPNPIDTSRPIAIDVNVTSAAGSYELTLNNIDKNLINDGYTIVDNVYGQIYRVLERYRPPNDVVIRLDKDWQGGALPGHVWVVSPPANGGRYPCIAVYQKIMRF